MLRELKRSLLETSYVDQIIEKERDEMIITQTPKKFKTVLEKNKYKGVTYTEDLLTDDEFESLLNKIISKNKVKAIISKQITQALPTDDEEFLKYFVDLKTLTLKNEYLFQNRILGLASYFKGSGEEAYPDVIGANPQIVKVPMTDYQLLLAQIRLEERKSERKDQ